MLKKRITNLIVALASVGGFAIAGPIALAASNSNAGNKVTICHATGSTTNPFVQITPNANGVVSGHEAHQDARDIIPSFDYNDHGTTKHFAGQNFDAQGMAILNNGCKVPGGQGGGVTPPTTTTTPPTQTGGQGGGQVLGAASAAGVTATPSGGVNAGTGGVSTISAAALTGLAASAASLALGIRRLSKP
jgi:hypothetical protein